MSSSPAPTASRNRFLDWLPATVDKRVRVIGWLNFLCQTIIIGTGGAVRLTGSGLGCPTWPLCTSDSLIPTAELTWHSLVEFGNRTMTGVLLIVSILAVLFTLRMRRERRDLFTLSVVILVGVLVQAVVGGILVLFHLHANLVSFHYLLSLVLVCIAAAFLVRMNSETGPRERAVPLWYAITTHLTTFAVAVTVFVGVLTTGAGPHSGDDEMLVRNGLDASVLEHVHAWPGYVTLALTLVLVIAAGALRLPTLRWAGALLAVEIVQIAVGLYQARNGLPVLAVGVHMVLAALLAAAMVVVVMRLKRPVAVAAHS